MSDVIEVLASEGGGYFFRRKAANGEIIASSGSESFEHPTDARAAAIRAFGEEIPIRVFYRKDEEDEGGD